MPFNRFRLNIISFFLLLISIPSVHAQIRGKVVDEQNQAIAAASVYINNTTFGVLTDAKGGFELQHFPTPPFELSISCVGYTSSTIIIKPGQQGMVIIVLNLKVSSLDEVLVLSPEKDGWAKFGEDFKREFIGYSTFADQTEILNKEVLNFTYDAQLMKLYVSAAKPLRIRNKATGYLITFWLDDYRKDYPTNKILFSGTAHFEPMIPKREKQSKRWRKNRLSAYRGSINHFMRSVYHDSVYEEGFELRVYQRMTAEEYAKKVPVKTDTIYSIRDTAITFAITNFLGYTPEYVTRVKDSLRLWLITKKDKNYSFILNENVERTPDKSQKHVFFSFNPAKPNEKWIQYFDHTWKIVDTFYEKALEEFQFMASGQKVKLPPKQNPVYYGYLSQTKIPIDSFAIRNTETASVTLKFKDYLDVTYTKETLEEAYVDSKRAPKPLITDFQKSLLHLENEEGINVFPDGNYYNAYDLLVKDYWSYEKLDKMLPYDYIPEQ